jgi:transposase-like protein
MQIKSGNRTYLSDGTKLRIIQEVLSGSTSKGAAQRKYGIKGKSAITKWMRSFGIKEPLKPIIYLKKPEDPDKGKDLDERVKELEQALKWSELKAEAYSKMIDIAEEKLSIKIRKKLPTKRSEQ